jgi:glycine cleavage system aminomethyltransferase T
MTSVAIDVFGVDRFGDSLQTATIGQGRVVWNFGDFEAECSALRNGAGIIDVSSGGPIRVSGAEALDLLQACLTRDIEFLIPDRAQWSIVLRGDGTIVDVVTVIAGDGEYTVLTGPGRGADVEDALQKAARDFEVQIDNLEGGTAVFAVEGPRSWQAVADVLGAEYVSLAYENVLAVEIDGRECLLARIGVTGEYGYTFILPGDIAADLWEQLVASGAVPVGHQARETAMLEVRQPIVHREVKAEDTVVSAGLNWLVDLGKEDFVGREALVAAAAAPPASGPVGFVVRSGSVRAEDSLYVGDEAVGEILYVVESPTLGASIGLARVTREWQAAGLDFVTDAAAVRTLAPPYLAPTSWSTAIDV